MAKFTFIDLFSGAGGFRLALERLGGKCVFSSDIDEHARQVYEANFGEAPSGDLTAIPSEDIPQATVLTAGFPCQPFSSMRNLSKNKPKSATSRKPTCSPDIAARNFSKKTYDFSSATRGQGFNDPDLGMLFFETLRIIADTQPSMFILENVKGMLTNNRADFEIMLAHLARSVNGGENIYLDKLDTFRGEEFWRDNVGYDVYYAVLSPEKYGVPQTRSRVFIVGFNPALRCQGFSFPPQETETATPFSVCYEQDYKVPGEVVAKDGRRYDLAEGTVTSMLFDPTGRNMRKVLVPKRSAAGYETSFAPNRVTIYEKPVSAILKGYFSGDPWTTTFVQDDAAEYGIRYLTESELKCVMDFPQDYDFSSVSRVRMGCLLGNSVVVGLVEKIARQMMFFTEFIPEAEVSDEEYQEYLKARFP